MTKLPLKTDDGQTLKMYTILVGNSSGIVSFVQGIHTSFAYSANQAIADAQAEYAIVEPQVARHAKRRVCHAGAIEVVDDVKEENKR